MRDRLRYLICTVPRSGSTYLCYMVSRSGRLGMQPPRACEQFWRLLQTGFQGVYWKKEDAKTLFEDAFKRSASPNGVEGFKLMWHQFERIVFLGVRSGYRRTAREDFEKHLAERVCFVWLRRRDTLRQAISWVKASSTGVWRADIESSARSCPDYNYIVIYWTILKIRHAERQWRRFFRRAGVEPLVIHYEDYLDDPGRVAADLAGFLNLGTNITLGPDDRVLRRQGDEQSENWVRRFHEDSASLSKVVPAVCRSIMLRSLWREITKSLKGQGRRLREELHSLWQRNSAQP